MANPAPSANGHAGAEQSSSDADGGTTSSPTSRFSRSLYAEDITNPLPELAVVSEPEPVSNLVHLECDDSASTRPVVEPDDIGERRGSSVVYAGEKPTLWRKYRTPVIIALVIAVLVLIATVVGVVCQLLGIELFGHYYCIFSASYAHLFRLCVFRLRILILTNVVVLDGGFLCIPYPSSVVPIYQGITKANKPGVASVPAPSECADSSDFLTSVSFIGVTDAGGNGGWKTTYYGASDSEDCCTHCFKKVSAGCNSWAYMPSSGFVGTSCAMITGWDTGEDKDSTCPSGHGATIYFTLDSDNSSDVGAAGPCGVIAD